MRLQIRGKLILTFLGALVIAVAAVAGVIFTILMLLTSADGSPINALRAGEIATTQAGLVQQALEAGAPPAQLRQAAIPADLPPGLRIRLIDKDAKVWVDTAGNEGRIATGAEMLEWFEVIVHDTPTEITMPERIMLHGEHWGYYAITFPARYGLNINLNDGSPQSNLAVTVFVVGISLALLVNIILFWAFGWHIVKPLRRLSRVVSQIAAGDLSARAGLAKRHDELGQLAHDLDLMATRLEEARDQAAASERARRYLVASASHDLRTPLTALLAHAEAIRTSVSEDPQASLAVIERKGLQLKRLIDDLFELAALDATAERWQTLRIDLAELLRQSVVGILPELEAHGIEVEAAIPEEPAYANLAPGKLERVLDNLLTNTLKYAADGGWLGVTLTRTGDRIRVELTNRGEPIPPEVAEQLFDRFYRADSARSTQGGAGLGLAIAREIIQRHGGQIGVYGPPEGGATFWFELPAAM